ncbi:MAG TPA: hypothetical protein VEW05_28700 [Candidatus Polarisedimenticolia bacterium]|nr:hypothetical protein [Candidatus Polarisedimenticolia bacterium]
MTLGKRIAIYTVVCALWAGFLFGAAALRYDDTARSMYALQVRSNQEILKYNEEMAELKIESKALDVQLASQTACLNRHRDSTADFSSVCSNLAEAEANLARLKMQQAAGRQKARAAKP